MFNRLFSSGPSEKKRRDMILIEASDQNPFPGRPATATPDNPPAKLQGRDAEVNELLEFIHQTSEDVRPLVIIQGETGMGKSALTSYVFNQIRTGELDTSSQRIFGAFLEAYGEVKDFRLRNFYFQIIRSMERYGMLGKLTALMTQMIGQLIYTADTAYFREHFEDWDPFESHELIIKRLNDRRSGPMLVNSILTAFSLFYPHIQNKWSAIDYNFVNVLMKSQSASPERMKALNAIQRGTSFEDFEISTDAEAKEALHSLVSLIRSFRSDSVLTIFIDQLEELFDKVSAKDISTKFFTLLLTLRQVPNICIVLSGNLQSYAHLTSNLNEDMADQLEQWHSYLHIRRLDSGKVGLIAHNMMSYFWNHYDMTPDPSLPYYPLSAETISYLYQKYDRNLRKTLIGLHDIFEDFKLKQEVKDLSHPIKAIGELNIIHDPLQLPLQIQEDFKNYLLSDEIQDKERSAIPERSIHSLLEIVRNHTNYISELSMSPSLPKSGRKPDIYYKLGGNLFHADQRRIGIEVKCYRRGNQVSKQHVEKTTELLEYNDLDYVIWITNVDLHSEAINAISDHLKEKQIGITPQTDEQLAYTYWGYMFSEALNRDPTLGEAKTLLRKIGVPELFLNEPKQLIETENLRKQRIKDPIPVKKENPLTDGSIDDYFDNGEEKPTIMGIDLHNKMKNFVETEIDELIKEGRKQIKKEKLYKQYLKKLELSEQDVPIEEFIELIEQLAKTKANFKTTQKLIKLIY